jgi:hypothetical protein
LLPIVGLRTADAPTRFEGLVLAQNTGKDDSVRRAAAIEPIATPPTKPTSRTIARYPPQRRRNVARKQYHATLKIRLTSLATDE